MDIQKEREAFQNFCEQNFDVERHEQTYFDEQTQSYENDLGECTESINMAWSAWQAAKAQAVPKGFGDIQSWIAVNSFSALDASILDFPVVDANELAEFIDSLNIDVAVPEWIDASDRLPEEGEEVLVHHCGHIVQATRDKKYSGGFKQRNCYGLESISCYVSHWMPMSVKLPERFHFYYEHDAKVAKEKTMKEAREPAND